MEMTKDKATNLALMTTPTPASTTSWLNQPHHRPFSPRKGVQ
jgi:hypothetical protein